MKIIHSNIKTNESKILVERSWISRTACINYNIIQKTNKEFKDDMVEMLWWDEFENMVNNKSLFAEAVMWCRENCEGLVYANPFSGKFEFESKEDALAFTLRWI